MSNHDVCAGEDAWALYHSGEARKLTPRVSTWSSSLNRQRALKEKPGVIRKSTTFYPLLVSGNVEEDSTIRRPNPDLPLGPITTFDLALDRFHRVSGDRLSQR
jgi:hypothetical protein